MKDLIKTQMQKVQVNHRWISASEYAKQTGLGVEKVKQFIRAGKIEGEKTEDGYWKVKVYKDDAVPKKIFDEEHNKRIEAETLLNAMKKILEGVKI